MRQDKQNEVVLNGVGQGNATPNGCDHRTVLLVFVILVIDLLAFTVILPLFPSLLEYYGQHDKKGGLYSIVHQGVDSFRRFVGAPDTPRWNSVLFGGKTVPQSWFSTRVVVCSLVLLLDRQFLTRA